MPALNFQKQFKTFILNGSKPGTIRQVRLRNPIKDDDQLQLFTGMRTKQCEKFATKTCQVIVPVSVDWKRKQIYFGEKKNRTKLTPSQRRWFAETDICGTEEQFFDFFRKMNYQRPTVYICWDNMAVLKGLICNYSFIASSKSGKRNCTESVSILSAK